MISVARISLTPVKCFHLDHPVEVTLGRDGVASDRGQGPEGEIWFARYGCVVEPGRVRVGDPVESV